APAAAVHRPVRPPRRGIAAGADARQRRPPRRRDRRNSHPRTTDPVPGGDEDGAHRRRTRRRGAHRTARARRRAGRDGRGPGGGRRRSRWRAASGGVGTHCSGGTPMSLIETDEQEELRAAVARLAERYNYLDYVLPKARAGEPLTELWNEAA